ncbi:MAG: fimbrillin family protein [Prevotella sp.]|nr:fimbrillin family protein [Prevotella sp.]
MNIRTIKYLLIALLLPFYAGCNKNADTIPSAEGMPVVFSLGFGVTTRSTLDNVWPDNTRIAISKGSGNVLSYYTPENSASAGSGNAVTLTTDASNMLSWPSTNPGWTFTAWYPYSAAAPTGITVANDQSNITDVIYYGYDIMYAPQVANIYQATVPLIFYHQMSRVVATVNTDNTTNKETVTSVTFGEGTNDIRVSGTLTPGVTGGATTIADRWSTTSATDSYITMRKTSTETEETSHIYTFECMLPSQSGGSSDKTLLKITTSYTEDETQKSHTYIYKAAYDLKPGYQNNYYITCKEGNVIIIITSTVAGWNSTTVHKEGGAYIPDNQY